MCLHSRVPCLICYTEGHRWVDPIDQVNQDALVKDLLRKRQ
jgi:hypothetical protein